MVPLVEHSLFPEHVTKWDKMHHNHASWPRYSRGRNDESYVDIEIRTHTWC